MVDVASNFKKQSDVFYGYVGKFIDSEIVYCVKATEFVCCEKDGIYGDYPVR